MVHLSRQYHLDSYIAGIQLLNFSSHSIYFFIYVIFISLSLILKEISFLQILIVLYNFDYLLKCSGVVIYALIPCVFFIQACCCFLTLIQSFSGFKAFVLQGMSPLDTKHKSNIQKTCRRHVRLPLSVLCTFNLPLLSR